MKRFFITGTDTNCGKTYVTCLLIKQLHVEGYRSIGLKPVATGCYLSHGDLLNEDVTLIKEQNQTKGECINPWRYQLPVSPHLAAKIDNETISIDEINAFCLEKNWPNQDCLLIEGAGGLMVPLNAEQTWVDFLKVSRIPVIVVVGMKLGCLNHALMTASILKSHNIPCQGWIANQIDSEMLLPEENIQTLSKLMPFPFIGQVKNQAEHISFSMNHSSFRSTWPDSFGLSMS